ncbi:MAG: hypothetical protein A2887_04210 [Alphaproteobacteria bacterium RIFCSPLOWO2_01_FULL_40_26]|nr:MAG: hypothetical protein A3D15_05520 [Alphaproteobacteria bacterium RIFCSPHIGHO2_02_FULL_40_34]OFW88810.1 MAG: hypothetical protein A2794_04580 [Alphaproteobacteria bacterium RIFCSPHIGHO2_01_FULL_40_8]OFW94429.1 MAG: hypothetical protein A2887_04210 [Alphaproteobacteria bacterium RIFCSPLOWO2_01_FULL_40_26]OFX09390.1 MAG: hypothetical protein A3H30_01895 [Alphaproteobacteria bacterium RIFCSPLOWO2_02_FULL_40_19]OFX11322.1 MAG: hypothetical protein A3G22_02750 [Alphaproteobacteria bacterium RI
MELALKSDFFLNRSILFDTLRLSKLFEESGFNQRQAQILSEVIKTSQDEREKLAEEARKEIADEMEKKRFATGADLKIVEKNLELEIEKVRAEIEKVRSEIQQTKSETIKWAAGMLLVQSGLIVTLIKVFL